MAVNDAYTAPIRDSLMQKDPSLKFEDITFDPNTQNVSVRGQFFTKAPKNYSGTTYTSPTQFEQDWQRYSQARTQPAPTTNPTTTNTGPINYNNQFNDIFRQLQNQITTPQQPIDPYNTPQYKAFAAQSARRQNEGIRAAQEALGSSGFGRSSTLGERAGQIAGQEQQFLETQVVPQILAQQESQRQQQLSNLMNLLQPLFQQQQFAENTAQGRAGLTGNFVAPEVQAAIDQMTRNSSAWFNASPEEQRRLAAENQALGRQVGATQDAEGNWVYPRGQQTLASREFDQGVAERLRAFNYQQTRDMIADEQYKQKFDEDVRRYGLDYAAQEAYRDRQLDLEGARLALSQSKEGRISSSAASKADQEASTGGEKVSTAQFNDAYQTLLRKYGVAQYKEVKDAKGNVTFDTNAPVTYRNTTNPDQQSKLVIDVLNLGLNDDQTLQMLNKLGITEDQANELLGG